MKPARLARGLAAVAAGGLLFTAAVVSQAGAQSAPGSDLDITVTAEVVDADAPISVEATEVTMDAEGQPSHGVVVTWNDEDEAILGDERFTHHVTAESGEGDLVIAGRGCGASWAEAEEEVIFPCTLDLQAFPVEQGDSHEYPVTIHPQVGPLTLQPGTYEVDQVVTWWRPDAEDDQQQTTIRLTYQVTEAAETTPLDISVQASIATVGAPVSVVATDVTETDGLPSHGVRVTWNGDAAARLGDARFTHDVTAINGTGHLVTEGRGCGANWNDETGEVLHVCTADLQLIDLAPGESHEYPVRIVPEIGTLALEPGVYVVEETIGWEPVDGAVADGTGAGGEFVVRLTYTVTEGTGGGGVLTPEPEASGVSFASWSGGPASDLPPAESYWVAVEGQLVPYVPDAPAFLNARFMELYPDDIPAGTLFIVVR